MAATQTSTHEASAAALGAKRSGELRVSPVRSAATDDEILGIGQELEDETPTASPAVQRDGSAKDPETEPTAPESENLRAALDANPELRQAWQDAQAYRETFKTPEEARVATGLLAELNHMDALFFSQRPGDHAALARAVAELDPAAFASLAKAMNQLATEAAAATSVPPARENGLHANHPNTKAEPTKTNIDREESVAQAQEEFFHTTNAAAVQSIVDAIESQVERLLPEAASKNTRSRVVGEIYRELDNTLRSNRQFAQQMRDAFRSGGLDADHQRAIVSLISGRARQALPGVAKRVLGEWTSTVVAANQGRRERQRAAERRVDIAGSNRGGNEGRRPTTPRDIDYARMSDADILNL